LGLLGKNGSGKTTLIKARLGIIRIDGGTALLVRTKRLDPRPGEPKPASGYVPQVISLYPWMRVRQIIDYTGGVLPEVEHEPGGCAAARLAVR
jgi:ABC-2 type transport system ATP-binding protein